MSSPPNSQHQIRIVVQLDSARERGDAVVAPTGWANHCGNRSICTQWGIYAWSQGFISWYARNYPVSAFSFLAILGCLQYLNTEECMFTECFLKGVSESRPKSMCIFTFQNAFHSSSHSYPYYILVRR